MKPSDLFHKTRLPSKKELSDYLTNSASTEKRHEIEERMIDDPLVSDAVDGLKNVPDLLARLPTAWPGQSKSTKTVRPSWLFPLRIAAGLALLITFGFLINQYMNNSLRNESLALYTKMLPPPNMVERGEGGSPSEANAAMEAYTNSDYKKAIELFHEKLKTSPIDNESWLYLGISQFLNNEPSLAIASLEKARFNSTLYYQSATWYLALAQIKVNNLPVAMSLLDELIESRGDYVEQAKKLKVTIE